MSKNIKDILPYKSNHNICNNRVATMMKIYVTKKSPQNNTEATFFMRIISSE